MADSLMSNFMDSSTAAQTDHAIQSIDLATAINERFGKNWTPQEERVLLDGYRVHGPDWPEIEKLLPTRKGIISKWKRLVASGCEEAIHAQRHWRLQREKQQQAEAAGLPPPPAVPLPPLRPDVTEAFMREQAALLAAAGGGGSHSGGGHGSGGFMSSMLRGSAACFGFGTSTGAINHSMLYGDELPGASSDAGDAQMISRYGISTLLDPAQVTVEGAAAAAAGGGGGGAGGGAAAVLGAARDLGADGSSLSQRRMGTATHRRAMFGALHPSTTTSTTAAAATGTTTSTIATGVKRRRLESMETVSTSTPGTNASDGSSTSTAVLTGPLRVPSADDGGEQQRHHQLNVDGFLTLLDADADLQRFNAGDNSVPTPAHIRTATRGLSAPVPPLQRTDSMRGGAIRESSTTARGGGAGGVGGAGWMLQSQSQPSPLSTADQGGAGGTGSSVAGSSTAARSTTSSFSSPDRELDGLHSHSRGRSSHGDGGSRMSTASATSSSASRGAPHPTVLASAFRSSSFEEGTYETGYTPTAWRMSTTSAPSGAAAHRNTASTASTVFSLTSANGHNLTVATSVTSPLAAPPPVYRFSFPLDHSKSASGSGVRVTEAGCTYLPGRQPRAVTLHMDVELPQVELHAALLADMSPAERAESEVWINKYADAYAKQYAEAFARLYAEETGRSYLRALQEFIKTQRATSSSTSGGSNDTPASASTERFDSENAEMRDSRDDAAAVTMTTAQHHQVRQQQRAQMTQSREVMAAFRRFPATLMSPASASADNAAAAEQGSGHSHGGDAHAAAAAAAMPPPPSKLGARRATITSTTTATTTTGSRISGAIVGGGSGSSTSGSRATEAEAETECEGEGEGEGEGQEQDDANDNGDAATHLSWKSHAPVPVFTDLSPPLQAISASLGPARPPTHATGPAPEPAPEPAPAPAAAFATLDAANNAVRGTGVPEQQAVQARRQPSPASSTSANRGRLQRNVWLGDPVPKQLHTTTTTTSAGHWAAAARTTTADGHGFAQGGAAVHFGFNPVYLPAHYDLPSPSYFSSDGASTLTGSSTPAGFALTPYATAAAGPGAAVLTPAGYSSYGPSALGGSAGYGSLTPSAAQPRK